MAYTHPILTLPADRPRTSRLIALLLGCLTTLAFEPFGWSLLAPVLLLPLLFVCLTIAPRDAAGHAFWYGLGLFLCGTYWIYISVVVFGEAPGWIALFLMVGLSAIMAVWLWSAGYVISYLAQGEPLLLLPIAPAAWVLVEWLRGWVASGFPWLAFGYAQADSSLAGWAPLLGVYGSSFAVLLSASAIVAAIMSRGRVRQFSLAMILLPWLVGAVLLRVDWTEADGDPLKVTILQAGMSQDQKWLPENRLPTLDFYRSHSLAEKDSDIVVWPEVAIPNLISREREFIAALAEDAKASGQTILFGILEDNESRGQRRVYNSVVLLDGQRQQVYRKRHLVPFGEYFPVPDKVREWMKMMSLPYSDLSPGADRQALLTTRGGTQLALMVCYEDAYNSEQLYAFPEAGLLVNVSNDAWFGNSIAPHQHLEIARMRSIETGRPGIRATNTGISAFINYDGRLLQAGGQFRKETLTAILQPRKGSTPFVAYGNWPIVALCCLLLGFFWIQRPR